MSMSLIYDFLNYRNGLMPKKLHLEIALGNIFPKEGVSTSQLCSFLHKYSFKCCTMTGGKLDGLGKDFSDYGGHDQQSNDVNDSIVGKVTPGKETDQQASSSGLVTNTDTKLFDTMFTKFESNEAPSSDLCVPSEDGRNNLGSNRNLGAETNSVRATNQLKPEVMNWSESVGPSDALRGFIPASSPIEKRSELADAASTRWPSVVDSSFHPNQQVNSHL